LQKPARDRQPSGFTVVSDRAASGVLAEAGGKCWGADYDGFLVTTTEPGTWYGLGEAFHQSLPGAFRSRRCREPCWKIPDRDGAGSFPQGGSWICCWTVLDLARSATRQKLVSEHGILAGGPRAAWRLDWTGLLANATVGCRQSRVFSRAPFCNMSSPTCSRSCTVRGFRPPTTSLRQRFVRWWWTRQKPGVATADLERRQELNRILGERFLRTCWQQGKDAFEQFANPTTPLLRSQLYSNLVPASLCPPLKRRLLPTPPLPH